MNTNLQPGQNDIVKSFYGKATIHREKSIMGIIEVLESYGERVATYNIESKKIEINGYFSQTTARHINTFLEKWGFTRMNKKELESHALIN